MRSLLVLTAWVSAISVFVHFMWEMLVVFAYDMTGVPVERVVLYHFRAALGDGVLMLIPYWIIALRRRDPGWIGSVSWPDVVWVVAIGLVLSVGIERAALAVGRWSYAPAMPLIPGLGVGLLPVLQLILPPLPIYWAARRLAPDGIRRGH